ncbi:uncharacterized protein [Malus domestica]|uniref:uncharacterized protein n=1 Tax=Malus domestica TaxID=3750 RepID=UPI00397652FF
MKSYGEDIGNQRIVQKLLINLPKSNDSIVAVIENTKDLETVDVQDVVATLKGYEQRIERHYENISDKAFPSLSIAPKKNNYNANHNFKPTKNWRTKGMSATVKKGEDIWYVDNGCSNRMTGRENLSVNIDKSVNAKVETGTWKLVDMVGNGDLLVETKQGKRYIKETMLVPGLKENLLRVG